MNLYPKNIDKQGDYYKVLDSFYVYAGDESDMYVQKSCRENGIWDIDLTRFMIDTIKPGWNCLDIGANTGYFTEVMARCSGKNGSVLAFEPQLKLVEKYNDSRKLNNYDEAADITMYPFGLSNQNKTTYINIWKNNVGGSSIVEVPDQGTHQDFGEYYNESVEVKRLDSFYHSTPNFIKIDIEAHEPFAFGGFNEEIFYCPIIVIELGWSHPKEFLEDLSNYYTMNSLLGPEITVNQISSVPNMDVVLRRKR
jgi:FkbM family methyltransferase